MKRTGFSISVAKKAKKDTADEQPLQSPSLAQRAATVRIVSRMECSNSPEDNSNKIAQNDTTFQRGITEIQNFRKIKSNNNAAAAASSYLDEADIDLTLDSLPRDWSIKSMVKITAKDGLDWCNNITTSSNLHSRALNVFVTSKHDDDKKVQFCSSLFYYCHPADTLPKSMMGAWNNFVLRVNSSNNGTSMMSSASKADTDEWFGKRLIQWRDAMMSLSSSLKSGSCKSFYYQTPQFVLLFRSEPMLNAIMSHSTRTFRSQLTAQNIPYVLPFARNMDTSATTATFSRSSSDINLQYHNFSIADGSPESVVIFENTFAVHSLIDFLINQQHDDDLPLLLSDSPFAEAAIKNSSVTCTTSNIAKFVSQYHCQVNGIILPSAFEKMTKLFQEELPQGYQGRCGVFSHTKRLNVHQIYDNGKSSSSGDGGNEDDNNEDDNNEDDEDGTAAAAAATVATRIRRIRSAPAALQHRQQPDNNNNNYYQRSIWKSTPITTSFTCSNQRFTIQK